MRSELDREGLLQDEKVRCSLWRRRRKYGDPRLTGTGVGGTARTGLGLDHWARQQGCHEPDATRPWMACQHSRTDRLLLFFLQSSAAAGDDGGEAEKIPEPTGLQGLRARMAVEWLLWRGMQ